jgi:hypothetical protein
MVPSGIRFNDCLFTEPSRVTDWKVPKYAGLFVILSKDANWAPKPYRPLYFGEFGNNTPEPAVPMSYGLATRSEGDALFISVLPMPFSTTAQRWTLRNELLCGYNTAWQARETRSAGGGLANQTGVARLYPEEAAQILLLLTGAKSPFEPQPERGPRHRIGFV